MVHGPDVPHSCSKVRITVLVTEETVTRGLGDASATQLGLWQMWELWSHSKAHTLTTRPHVYWQLTLSLSTTDVSTTAQ